jgi:hypothetical protein
MNCFKFITILFSLSIQNLALSQTTTITVSGVIKDSTQRNPLAFATVSLLHRSQPDTLFKTAYSNKKGEFQFTQVDTGAYLVTASYAGYKQYQREFRIDKEMDSVLPDIYWRPQ